MKKIASSVVVSACTQRVNAIKKHLGAKDEVFVNGEPVKAAQLAQVYQDALDTRAAATSAKGELKAAMAERNAAEAKRLSVDAALEPYVLQRFGASSTEAEDFDYAPRKVPVRTAVSKAKATLLTQATRAARGARQQIKGTLSPEAAAALAALSGSTSSAAGTAAAPAATSAAPPATAPAAASPLVAAATNGAAHS